MSDFYQLTTILNRPELSEFSRFYKENNILVSTISLASGTAKDDILDYLGLSQDEKVVITSIITASLWQKIKRELLDNCRFDEPGRGIAFIVPLASIGSKAQLCFMCDGQNLNYTEEASMKNTEYQLIVVVSNAGMSDMVMDAAKKGGAGGGTVIHAKGTGMNGAEKFFGISLANEKEIIYIVSKTSQKDSIMNAIMSEAGPTSVAGSICYSLPVTQTCGLKLDKPSAAEDDKNL